VAEGEGLEVAVLAEAGELDLDRSETAARAVGTAQGERDRTTLDAAHVDATSEDILAEAREARVIRRASSRRLAEDPPLSRSRPAQ
jgi:hypothetical protein